MRSDDLITALLLFAFGFVGYSVFLKWRATKSAETVDLVSSRMAHAEAQKAGYLGPYSLEWYDAQAASYVGPYSLEWYDKQAAAADEAEEVQ